MIISADLRLKIRHFLKKYKKIIVFIVFIFILLITINRILIMLRNQKAPTTTYTPHISVLDSNSKVPTKVAEGFEDFIDKYYEYCNKKDYVNAYNLISEDCKKNYFNNSFESFKAYVDSKFDQPKKYAIQNYSNYNNKYIYNVKIFNDFLATGLTNEDYVYQEEKMVASYDNNKNIVFSVGNYIESEKIQSLASNDYLKAEVTFAEYKYNFVIYTLKITNRSDYTIVVQDGNANAPEVLIDLGGEYRVSESDQDIILSPGETNIYKLVFSKFYDTNSEVQSIILNTVRVMENYIGDIDNSEEEIENAKEKFSMTISLK